MIVKVFHGTEIKRFQFPNELDHSHLVNCLRDNFRDMLSDRHCFKYVDDEGDLCTLNESTFSDAFNEKTSSQNIYVCETVTVPTSERRLAPRIAPLEIIGGGIICDGCEETVGKSHHHCTACPDFDLCESCFHHSPAEDVTRHVWSHQFGHRSPCIDGKTAARSSTGSPRVGSEWTDVSLGAPHVEGLLTAMGLGNAKEAVKNFLLTGDFDSIVRILKKQQEPSA